MLKNFFFHSAIKNATVNDEDGSEVLSFVVDGTGTLNLIDRANTRGEDAVYVGVTDGGRGMAVVNVRLSH